MLKNKTDDSHKQANGNRTSGGCVTSRLLYLGLSCSCSTSSLNSAVLDKSVNDIRLLTVSSMTYYVPDSNKLHLSVFQKFLLEM